MGTRADFYVGKGQSAEWLGSIAYDGYPDGIPATVLNATSEADYRLAVSSVLASKDDATLPQQGWPWPWNTSHTTDFTYMWSGEGVSVYCFGEGSDGEALDCPDMSNRKNVTYGPRSGLIVVTMKEDK